MAKSKPANVDHRKGGRLLSTKISIGGGNSIEVTTDQFFGRKVYSLICFCGESTPRHSTKELAVDEMAKHVAISHPEALESFGIYKDDEDRKREEDAALFLGDSSTILNGTTTPREEQMGRHTHRGKVTRPIPGPPGIPRKLRTQPPTTQPPQATTSNSEGATSMAGGYPKGRPRVYFGYHVLRVLVEHKGERVFVAQILEDPAIKALNLDKKQIQNAVHTLLSKGEPIRVITAGNVWVYEDEVVEKRPAPVRPAPDPVAARTVAKLYAEEEEPPQVANLKAPIGPTLTTETVVILSKRRGHLVFVDTEGVIWKAEHANI